MRHTVRLYPKTDGPDHFVRLLVEPHDRAADLVLGKKRIATANRVDHLLVHYYTPLEALGVLRSGCHSHRDECKQRHKGAAQFLHEKGVARHLDYCLVNRLPASLYSGVAAIQL